MNTGEIESAEDEVGETGSTPVVTTILVLNLLIFLLWQSAAVPVSVMAEHYLISWAHLEEGRLWTLLTSVFSHNLLFHVAVNMIVLMSFGPPMERLMGGTRFLTFYLVAGLIASLAHAGLSATILDEPAAAALGASGALAGVLLLFSLTFPRATVLVLFFIPMPALIAALLFIGIDIWGLMMQIGAGGSWPIGHGAHLGGALTGLAYFGARGSHLRDSRLQAGDGQHDQ